MSSILSERILGGYYLGSEMIPSIKETFLDIMNLPNISLNNNNNNDNDIQSLSAIFKVFIFYN